MPWCWTSAPAPGEVDTEAGRARLEALDCAGCHGAEYRGGGAIPRIAGQQAAYLERQILGFGDAQRHHPPVGGGVRMYSIDADEAAAIAGQPRARRWAALRLAQPTRPLAALRLIQPAVAC